MLPGRVKRGLSDILLLMFFLNKYVNICQKWVTFVGFYDESTSLFGPQNMNIFIVLDMYSLGVFKDLIKPYLIIFLTFYLIK